LNANAKLNIFFFKINHSIKISNSYYTRRLKSCLNKSNFSVYPNPAKDRLTINLGDIPLKNTTLKLVNVIGETVLEKQVNANSETLTISHLPAGVYSLIITTPTERFTEKIVN